jgi:hypothetical protein
MFAFSRKFWHRLGTAGLVAAASVAALLIFAIVLTFGSSRSAADPTFLESKKQECPACHTHAPVLNKTGLDFKHCGARFCSVQQCNDACGVSLTTCNETGDSDCDAKERACRQLCPSISVAAPRPPPPAPAAGGCPAGQMACGAWCDMYATDPRACKYTFPQSCVALFKNITHCVPDHPPN